MSELENIVIYKSMNNLIYYSEMILKKYPKIERNLLIKDIRNINFRIMELIIKSYKEINKSKKYYYLNEIDVNLKLLKVYVRLSYKKKYINGKNYASWSKKITNINNLLFKWLENAQNN